MKRYVIERDLPKIGQATKGDLKDAAKTSNKAIAEVGKVKWEHSYVTADRTFCIYQAENEAAIHAHAKASGFPASRIYEVVNIISPDTAK
ncbi:MAG: DUF4242 domain-containing protein [Sphingomonadales bacterium]|nr:MAG: DUF4242 domain-containing protein [Sphingomonadales bacterium]